MTVLRVKMFKLYGRMQMKIVVDLNRCQCYAQCVFLAPSVFALHGEEALMYTPLAPENARGKCPPSGGDVPSASHPD